MSADLILFLFLALVAVVAALGMLISQNTVYSALFLVLNFATIALFYLLLGGPFIAMSQITVYAGAIMVLFLFVIMLLGIERLPDGEKSRWQRPVAIALGAALAVEAMYIFFFRRGGLSVQESQITDPTFGSPHAIASVLFNQYALPVQAVAIILLIAIVGVLVMVKTKQSHT